jgi:hypothetical protein
MSQKASIAAFLQEICEIREKSTDSVFCSSCNFVFFERRLSAKESDLLYSGYRDSNYNNLRLSVEPSYVAYKEMFDDPYSSYWTGRTNEFLGVVRSIDCMKAKTVLDFGGNGMIPSRIIPNASISIFDPAHGTSKNAPSTYDLIFASEVFEHLSDPKSELLKLVDLMHKNSRLIIDVPLEYSGSLKQEWDRQALYPGSLVTMHEHINHFSVEALKELADSANLKTLSIQISALSFLIGVFEI